jgi:hypothetical protein
MLEFQIADSSLINASRKASKNFYNRNARKERRERVRTYKEIQLFYDWVWKLFKLMGFYKGARHYKDKLYVGRKGSLITTRFTRDDAAIAKILKVSPITIRNLRTRVGVIPRKCLLLRLKQVERELSIKVTVSKHIIRAINKNQELVELDLVANVIKVNGKATELKIKTNG